MEEVETGAIVDKSGADLPPFEEFLVFIHPWQMGVTI